MQLLKQPFGFAEVTAFSVFIKNTISRFQIFEIALASNLK
jgi:hypothetical protein